MIQTTKIDQTLRAAVERGDVPGVVAMAGFLSRWNVSMATPLEPEPQEIGDKHLAPLGWSAGAHRR